MKLRQEFLVIYDISNNKARTSLYNALLAYGLFPLQKSMFWGKLTKSEKNSILRHLKEIMEESDKAIIIPSKIDKKDPRTHLLGYEDEDFADWKDNEVI